jgi:ABC-type transport system substrate-binding protein
MFKVLATPPVYGGLIPPGMPGHSPDIGLVYDPETSRRLLAEAGFPGGVGLPVFRGHAFPGSQPYIKHMISQWWTELGIRFDFDFADRSATDREIYALSFFGWIADFPDPDSFLSQFIHLYQVGWQTKEYDELITVAASLADRGQRMAIYRQADRLLVVD